MRKILLIEDDKALVENIKHHLECNNYLIYTVEDFSNVDLYIKQIDFNLVILDINLPKTDGFYICKLIREISQAPIIILSARNKEMEQILGMELGADDYITKPFSINVLLAKIKALIRRSERYSQKVESSYNINGLSLKLDTYNLAYNGDEIELAKNEVKLLKCFFENANKVLTREVLLESLWDTDMFIDDNTLTVNVTRVKKKLTRLGLIDIIKTKWGVGYVFDTKAIH